MTTLRNNIDGGPDATDINSANSGNGENDPFDTTSLGSGKVVQFSSTIPRPTAEYCLHVSTTGPVARVEWNTSLPTGAQKWIRFYVYWPTLPTTATALFITNSSAFRIISVNVDATGHLYFLDQNTSSNKVTMTAAMSAGAWYRVEARILHSTSSGNGELRLFNEDDDVPLDTVTFSGWAMVASSVASVQYGYPFVQAAQPDMYMSNIGLSNVDWFGPAPFRVGKGAPTGNLSNPIAVHIAVT